MKRHDIERGLSACDPNDTVALGDIAETFGEHPGYPDALIACVDSPDEPVTIGATWLIKHRCDAGLMMTTEQTDDLIARLGGVSHWAACLHLCQSVRSFDLSATSAGVLVRWLTPLLGHERPFLRAWSLDGLCRVAAAHRRYRREACEAADDAEGDAKASVRARVRRLRKELAFLDGA